MTRAIKYFWRRINRGDSSKLEKILAHRIFSIPIFFGIIFLLFFLTFVLGNYPVQLIEQLFVWMERSADSIFRESFFHDMLIDGIIPGIGGIAAFLPNIIILFTLIAILEDSGYMARTTVIVDRLMKKIGLSDKSFMPLVIGFGCNVPAIMATRTIENKKRRLITILIIPFMSCSARLPVYVLFISAFFNSHRTLILFLLYMIGIVIGGFTAFILSKFVRKGNEKEIILNMPPLRIPTIRSVLYNMWSKSLYFIKKMGGVILVASIIIWALTYFPLDREQGSGLNLSPESASTGTVKNDNIENSYIGLIGKTLLPVFRPLGFDWEMSVSIVTGLPAKEIIVSSLYVLYKQDTGDNNIIDFQSVWNKNSHLIYPGLSAFSFMLFVLISFPCLGTLISIRRETGSIKWMTLSFIYNTLAAWLISFSFYQVGTFFIGASN